MINVLIKSVARSGEEENGCPYGLSPSLHSLKRAIYNSVRNTEPTASSVVLNMLKTKPGEIIADEQAGFTAGRSFTKIS